MKIGLLHFYENFHKKIKLQRRIIGKKNFTYNLILNVLEPYLVGKKRILDIGCGAGTLSFYIAKKGNYVQGIDISPTAIKACKFVAKQMGLEENTDFQIRNFAEGGTKEQFDLILFSEVLEHLKNDKLAIEKVFNSLKSGGMTVISVPSKNSPLFKLGFTKKFDERVGHLRRYNQEDLIRLLRKTGFKILEIQKTEGILRNFLFVSKFTGQIIRVANRFWIVSDIFTFIDNITLKLFGESQLIVVAQKPKIKGK